MLITLRFRARSLRLGSKLQLLLIAGFLATLAGVLTFQTVQRVADTAAERHNANLRIVQVLAGPLSSALPIIDQAALYQAALYGYMEILEKNPSAAAVVIVKDGRVIKSQQSLDHVELSVEALEAVALDAASANQDRVIDEANFEFIGVPVVDSARRVIGALGIGWSTQGLYENIRRDALVQVGAIILACGTILLLLSRAVRHLVTRPLGIIADVIEMNTAGSGQHERTGLVLGYEARADEIGVLARVLGRFQQRAGEMQTLNAHFDAALNNMTQGLCLFDAQQRVVVHNRCFAQMFGVLAPGALAASLSAEPCLSGMFAVTDLLRHDGQDGGTHELPDGRVIQVSRQAIPHGGWVATYEDVTDRRRSQKQLSHMARHDALTGLPNRVLFREHMVRVLQRTRRGGNVAVLYLDLDGFKAVNDTLGHPAGDELLRLVAGRLRDNMREADLVARLGGDEFAIIQVDAEQPTEPAALADRLVQALRLPFEVVGQRIEIGTSIGVVLADRTASTPDELLRNADIALYRAKASGRGTWRFFEPGMDAEIQQRRLLEADLRHALTDEQFEVFYQPLIDARTQALTGFEALMRWRHPERGLVPPSEFIPLAEQIGLIKPMGAWILSRACTDAVEWPEHVKVAINLSSVQFNNGNLVQEVKQALATSGLAAHRLELEITESVLLQDSDATLGILHRLHALGVHIAMDDFGTGYSSLSYLRRFPFDKIKIDQSFVRNLAHEKGGIEIVRAVVGLGKALGMKVLAEGVETSEQRDMLQIEGCDELQGYLFSKPRPVQDVQGMITANVITQDSLARGPVLVIDNTGSNKIVA